MRRGWVSQPIGRGNLAPTNKRSYDRVNVSIQRYRALVYGYVSYKCQHALATWVIISRSELFFKNVFWGGQGYLVRCQDSEISLRSESFQPTGELNLGFITTPVCGRCQPSQTQASPHDFGISYACPPELSGRDVRQVPIAEFTQIHARARQV